MHVSIDRTAAPAVAVPVCGRKGAAVHMLWAVIGLILGVLLVSGISARLRFPAPILLLLVGLGASFVPGVPDYDVDPEFVLYVLLPPLLFAAVESGVVAIRKLIAPIMRLAVGMVLITALAVAVVLHRSCRTCRSPRRWRSARSSLRRTRWPRWRWPGGWGCPRVVTVLEGDRCSTTPPRWSAACRCGRESPPALASGAASSSSPGRWSAGCYRPLGRARLSSPAVHSVVAEVDRAVLVTPFRRTWSARS